MHSILLARVSARTRAGLPKVVALLASLLSPCLLGAGDWPQWRGPDRDGKVSGFAVPSNWAGPPARKWKTTVGIGDSTPAMTGERLFAHGRHDTDEVISCVDATSGQILWSNCYPAEFVVTGPSARHPGPRSSPVVTDGKICAVGVGGILSCLNATSGELLWRKKSTSDYLGAPYKFETAASPIIVDGQCIVFLGGNNKGVALAFDLASGEPRWKWEGENPAFASPMLMTVAGVRQLVAFTARTLISLDISSGRLLWSMPFGTPQGINASPVVAVDTLFYTGQGKGLSALKVEKQGDEYKLTPLWNNSDLSARFTTPLLKDNRLFGFTGRFFCADATTGRTLWSTTANDGQSASLVDAGSVLLALTVKSELIVFQPDDKAYVELARIKVADTETWAHPIVAGKRIFIRDYDSIALWMFE